jgi:hypothetical protein
MKECQAMAGNDKGQGGKVNPIQVQRFLGGVDYPAEKQALIDRAKEKGADERVMQALERLPQQSFETPADVSEAIGDQS